MQQQKTIQQYLIDYPSIIKGLNKLKIKYPNDFQQQLLEIQNDLHNIIIIAPQNSGKIIGLILISLIKFINQQSGIIIYLSHSKDQSQNLHHIIHTLTNIPINNLYMQQISLIQNKHIIIGSPLQVNNLWKKQKDKIISICIPQIDYLYGFGYGQSLQLLAGSINTNKINFKLSCINLTPQIDKFRDTWMKKTIKINYQPPIQNIKQKIQQQITHFYSSGDKITLPINLYITLKFGLVNPKILIIVDNIRQVYRYALFLERCMIPNVGIYNHQNPVNLRFYILSVWMNGTTNILISTKDLLLDLSNNIFKSNSRKIFKNKTLQLLNMTSIITINLSFLQKQYSILYQHFKLKPFIMTFIQNTQQQINNLQKLIQYQNNRFQHTIIKQIPINKLQIQAFRYRIHDVWITINNHKSDLYQQLDFKKKLLKTPQLKQTFQNNSKERQVLIKTINDLRKKIDHSKVTISSYIPQYLVPQCLKASYQQKMKALQATIQQQTPINQQKVKKVLRYVNLDQQNPQTTDISRLKLISARKRWKLLHGFKLKKVNKRRQKKGIFQTN